MKSLLAERSKKGAIEVDRYPSRGHYAGPKEKKIGGDDMYAILQESYEVITQVLAALKMCLKPPYCDNSLKKCGAICFVT